MGYDGKPFNVNQDRTIDPQTVQWYCTGCPYKGIKNTQRGNGGVPNPIGWDDSGNGPQGAMNRVTYVCNSPGYNYKTMIMYQMSSTIGFGYCPFFLEKWKQRESNTDPDDPPQI
jgi:hypothetical protein